MKIIATLQRNFEITCKCGTIFEIEEADIHLGEFKISGYWFTHDAVCAWKEYVYCPTCKTVNYLLNQRDQDVLQRLGKLTQRPKESTVRA